MINQKYQNSLVIDYFHFNKFELRMYQNQKQIINEHFH